MHACVCLCFTMISLSTKQYTYNATTVDSVQISYGEIFKGAPASHKCRLNDCKHGLTSLQTSSTFHSKHNAAINVVTKRQGMKLATFQLTMGNRKAVKEQQTPTRHFVSAMS